LLETGFTSLWAQRDGRYVPLDIPLGGNPNMYTPHPGFHYMLDFSQNTFLGHYRSYVILIPSMANPPLTISDNSPEIPMWCCGCWSLTFWTWTSSIYDSEWEGVGSRIRGSTAMLFTGRAGWRGQVVTATRNYGIVQEGQL
jgi:hypothetical protein